MATEKPGTHDEILAKRLAEGPLPAEEALRIIKALLKTLAFLHWTGRVHGNLNPSTVKIAPDGRVSLMDVMPGRGRATAVSTSASEPADPAYLSPEQIAGQPADQRSDVFSAGVIAYQLLTGRHPFGITGPVAPDLVGRIIAASPQRPPAGAASFPPSVGPTLRMALAKEAGSRFANAQNFLDALNRPDAAAETSPGQGAAPAGRASLAPRHSALRRYALPAGAAVLIVAVILAVLFVTDGSGAVSRTTTDAVLSTTTSTAPPSTSTAPSSTSTSLATTTTEVVSSTTTIPVPTTTPAPVPVVRHEDDATAVTYQGQWTRGVDSLYSGGSFQYANGSGASVTVTFYGTSLTWVAKKSPAYGIARVTLDGAEAARVDLYAEDTLYQQKVWQTGPLASGLHSVTLQWTGKKNDAASDTNVCVDAFEVTGELASMTHYEQTEADLVWAGTWKRAPVDSASGGSFAFADEVGAAVTVGFTGRGLEIIAKKGPNYGMARVTLDGTEVYPVDFYSPEVKWAVVVWSSELLPQATHTVTLEWTGDKNPAATGTNISLDAVAVLGTLR